MSFQNANKIKKSLFCAIIPAVVFLICLNSTAAPPSSRRSPVVIAAEKAGPAVVNISTTVQERVNPMLPFAGDDFFKDFFDDFFTQEYTYTSLGSGVIIDGAKGFIITNHHVVVHASKIKVITSNKKEFEAQLVGSDARSDLAVLKIVSNERLPAIEMGNSNDLMIGETVIAIGNPFGFSHTVTTGVVSALDRSVRTNENVFRHFIQTDASINPGNSGGPLLNIDGGLIGINTAIYQKAQGIGFAIPINKVKKIVKELIKTGEVVYPWLGVEIQELTADLKKSLSLPNTQNGVLIRDVEEESPAAKIGIKRGDIVLRLGGLAITDTNDFRSALSEYTSSEKIDLTILRKGQESHLSAELAVFPVQKTLDLFYRRLGIKVEPADKRILNKYGLNNGIVVDKIRAESEAGRLKIQPGDLILKVNNLPIRDMDEFKKIMSRIHYLPSLTLVIRRGPYAYSLTMPF
ncbi:MAG: Do family serine endopeptidase [Desulfobacteraceae bacterium]|nr:MAG: Do family serine endopeptidase [Desulfobacteraceae bacterium]